MSAAPVVMLLGPTASGKSALALALAERFPIEIVSVDSALVYREMDIGTAKPSPDERRRVAHHLIDLIDPRDAYSAAAFVADAQQAIADIERRGRLPLLVGGTMLYAHAFIHGLAPLPSADAQLRARLDALAAAEGWPALHRRLQQLDPPTAARLQPNDAQRIQRALEVHELTGTPLSQLLRSQQLPRRPVVKISLEPSNRAALHDRIARRFAQMLQSGLVAEVRRLRARGDLDLQMPSMRCVGYRQTWEYLDGQFGFEELIERGVAATRQLAKRQLTWLRSDPHRHVVDCLSASALQAVSDIIGRTAR
ncbi:MAG TPA: tRNA (adenosine(37)-N6)-dimethylallyltransferase MiaA [Burkholderiaceae bacterium]|nr:tRNA (adenosine(37)-N6)-dimethylallyltransferase MiaA [Burkholderiaceae bacterium]